MGSILDLLIRSGQFIWEAMTTHIATPEGQAELSAIMSDAQEIMGSSSQVANVINTIGTELSSKPSPKAAVNKASQATRKAPPVRPGLSE